MNIIKKIHKVPISHLCVEDKLTTVTLFYKGKMYSGTAQLHPDDSEFFSERVGKTIALSRARIAILKDEYEQVKSTYKSKCQFYQEVLGCGAKTVADVDPSGAFLLNIKRTQERMKRIKSALDKEKKELNEYLKGQKRLISVTQRYRMRQERGQI